MELSFEEGDEIALESERCLQSMLDGFSDLDLDLVFLDPAGHVIPAGRRDAAVAERRGSPAPPEGSVHGGVPAHALRRALAGERFEDEGWHTREDGTVFWARVIVSALRDRSGHLRGFWKLTRDLSERRNTQRAIERVKLALEESRRKLADATEEFELLSMIVIHDLRSPFAVVTNLAQLIDERCGAAIEPQSAHMLQTIRRIAATTMTAIDDLTHFCRLARAPVEPACIDMQALLAAAWAEVGADSRVELKAGRLPRAVGDPVLLARVWVNLLANAVKYSSKRAQPVIEVTGRESRDDAIFSVRDNGVGFDMAHSGKLFKAFHRLHNGDDFPGSGLGLAIVHRIVSRHGGRVCAEARVGEGAAFEFHLPLKPAATTAGAPAPEALDTPACYS